MKRLVIPLITAVIVAIFTFIGCAKPAPTPTPTPAPTPAQAFPYEGLGIKPDGTSYRITNCEVTQGIDILVNSAKWIESLLTRSGAEYSLYDPEWDIEKQISFMEDLVALKSADAVIIHAIDEHMLVPVVDKCMDAGIPVVCWDEQIYSDKVVSKVYHHFDGPEGTNVCGKYFVEIAEQTGEPLYIYSIWADRAMEMVHDRHVGLEKGIGGSPLVTVMDSGTDSFGSDEVCANLITDAFTAHPELNAVFCDDGGGPGVIEGLRSMDRLFPVGNTDHVVLVMHDIDTPTVKAMQDGYIDGVSTHATMEVAGDIPIKVLFTYVMLGQPVPQNVPLPMKMLTSENFDTEKMYGQTPVWPLWAPEEWDKWPILDTTSLGIEIPTKDMIGTGHNPFEGYLENHPEVRVMTPHS